MHRIHRYLTRDVKLDDGNDDEEDEIENDEDDENDYDDGWMEFTREKSGLIVDEIPVPC